MRNARSIDEREGASRMNDYLLETKDDEECDRQYDHQSNLEKVRLSRRRRSQRSTSWIGQVNRLTSSVDIFDWSSDGLKCLCRQARVCSRSQFPWTISSRTIRSCSRLRRTNNGYRWVSFIDEKQSCRIERTRAFLSSNLPRKRIFSLFGSVDRHSYFCLFVGWVRSHGQSRHWDLVKRLTMDDEQRIWRTKVLVNVDRSWLRKRANRPVWTDLSMTLSNVDFDQFGQCETFE